MVSHWSIIFAIISGSSAAYLAGKRGKDPFLWFFLGSLFGILGLCFLFFFVKPKKVSLPAPQKKIIGLQKFWYYLDQTNAQHGPMSYHALSQAQKEGKISLDTYVWNEELPEWKPLKELISS